jgi:hypothetical protein
VGRGGGGVGGAGGAGGGAKEEGSRGPGFPDTLGTNLGDVDAAAMCVFASEPGDRLSDGGEASALPLIGAADSKSKRRSMASECVLMVGDGLLTS